MEKERQILLDVHWVQECGHAMPCLTGHYSQHLSWLILASSCTHNFLTALVKFKAQVQLISLGRQGRVFRNAKICSKLFLGKIDSELLNQVFSNWMFVLFCFVYQKRKGLSQNETTMFHFQSKNLSDIGGYVKLKSLFVFILDQNGTFLNC